jgi:CDP-glucose 4,6-dehydratase
MGTANILEALRKTKSDTFVGVITTDKVYRNADTRRKFVENDPIMGADPYSASKASAENVVSAWRSIPNLDKQLYISSLRAGNVIGGGDLSANRLLPDLVRSFTLGDAPTIRNPNSIRPWQHALDPILGYLLAVNHSIETGSGDDFNFGPTDEALTVEEVANIACETWSPGLHPILAGDKSSLHEALFLDLSSEKAKEILHWEPNWSQEESVKRTIEWWKSLGERSATECCLVDIDSIIDQLN